MENKIQESVELYYELYLRFRVTLFKTTPWGIKSRDGDSESEKEALRTEMDKIVSKLIPMTSLEKKCKTNYEGRSGTVKWYGTREETIPIVNGLKKNLNVVAYGNQGRIEMETETVYDY